MPMCYMQKLVLSIPKVYFKPTFFPIYSLQVPDIYLNYGDFTWRVSDCEGLVGDKLVNRFMTNYFTQKFHSVFLIDNKF